MLKEETINLIKANKPDFFNVFSTCIGRQFLIQNRFLDYVRGYKGWSTDVQKGILKLDEKIFNVEYIGTTSTVDNYWFSADIEKIIPAQYVSLLLNAKRNMQQLGLEQLTATKIELNNDINGYNLSMIYLAFAPQNVVCYCGSGNTSIYMFVKDLPDSLFKQINPVEFSNLVMQIISTFNVNHRLMIKALLFENSIKFTETEDEIIAKLNEKSTSTIKFKGDWLESISGDLSL